MVIEPSQSQGQVNLYIGDMDRISRLPDDLLVRILSFLPLKVAVTTSLVSKRWECLWMWVSKLEFVPGSCTVSKCERLRCFLDSNLSLHRALSLSGESLRRFLSIYPVLEDLTLDLSGCLQKGKISVIVPTLQILSLYMPYEGEVDGLVIKTPNLKYLKLVDHSEEIYPYLIENMPKLEEAYVDVKDITSLIRSITSVKRLTICSEAVYGKNFVFHQLEYLKLCVGRKYSLNLLIRLLRDSPNLRELDLYEIEDHGLDGLSCWNEPSTVPECMVSNLQTFNWSGYYGRPQELNLMRYILTNTRRLNQATISYDARFVPIQELLLELLSSPRVSPRCQVIVS